MALKTPTPLRDLVRGPKLRVRTGLWLVSPQELGELADMAVLLEIGTFDLRQELLASLPADANFVALTASRVLELMDVAAARPMIGNCALVMNLDLLLARLPVAQRADVWDFAFGGFAHRTNALLMAMPSTAVSLLPSVVSLEQWRQAGRIFPPKE